MSPKLVRAIQRTAKRVYHILGLNGYARMDFRLDSQSRLYFLEANPNAQLAYGEDLAESAERAGISYDALIQRILNIGLSWKPEAQR